MTFFRLSTPRVGRIGASIALLVATVAPALVPALSYAATVTDRSVALSSSTKSATGVNYKVKFTAQHDGTGAFFVDFCTTPAVGTACTTPTDLNVGTAATATSGYTASTIDANSAKVIITAPVDTGDPVELDITGLTNPSAAGAIYARIVTYADNTALGTNTSAAPGTHYDDGTVALDITDGFSIDGAVLETLTFCASGTDVNDCSAPTPIDIALGTSGVLDTTAGSDGDVYTVVATNASSGAVVNLKSDALNCGGLYRDGVSDAAHCGIAPITTAGPLTSTSVSEFGAKLTLTQPSEINSGTGTLASAANWSSSNYYMPYVAGNASGVTSVYGAEVYNTSGAPTTVGKGQLSFNAHRTDVTPAGNYSAKFSLIATGKF